MKYTINGQYIDYTGGGRTKLGVKASIKGYKKQGYEMQYILNCLLSSKENAEYHRYKTMQRLNRVKTNN